MNRLIIAHFQWIGAILVSIFLISVVVAIYFYDLLKIWNAYRARLRAFRAQRRQEEEDRRRKEEEAAEALRRNDPAAAPSPQPQPTVAPERKVMGFETDDPIDARIDSPATPDSEPAVESVPESESEAEPHHDPIEDPDPIPASTPGDSAVTAPEAHGEISAGGPASEQSTDTPAAQQPAEPQQPETIQEPEASQEPEGPAFQVNVTEEIEQADPDEFKPFDPTAELPRFSMPSIELFAEGKENATRTDILEQEENKERIIRALNQFRISISHIEATVGPTVTLYEIIPSEGVKISTIQKLENDIALNLAAIGIRIIAPIPGKGTIGIEVPNKEPQSVAIRSILGSKKYQECDYELPIAMGATISNDVFIADLAAMPHLLVAGATGMGKSVGMNVIISSLIYKKHPAELKFVLIDPKMVEFYPYRLLERHYLAKLPDEEDPIVTDMEKVVPTLKSLCIEMDARYNLLKEAGVVKITQYNELFIQRRLNPANGHRYMPYIVVIVDEYADLFMTAGKEVETPIARIAQKARAVGIHMIIATQRPSATVLTGIIKANFPGRIAFRVSQSIDSKVILDLTGANQLIGKGDMLFSHNGKLTRVQCAYIDTKEIKAVCESIDRQPGFEHAYYLPEYIPEGGDGGSGGNNNFGEKDPLFDEASRLVVSTGVASTSSLQRRYSIGYNRAGKIMDQMEAAGIVGPATGGKPRTVLVDIVTLESILNP
ncbi:MAG: DNA translocase FtsK [Muribaculaceae bacterium]|nr:DNA translocase FtsK [Muribaculaceae bacterium]